MKKHTSYFFLILTIAFSLGYCFSVKAQEIQVITHETVLQDTLGVPEIVFHFEIINISLTQQAVFIVRTINNLPLDWTSSLCFEDFCFPSTLDSIVTAPPFPQPPLESGDTLKASVHVTPVTTLGSGYIQIQVGTLANRNFRYTIDLTATAVLTPVEDENTLVTDYYLAQNYPNPFNPSTKINFGLKKAGNVEITVYNILGNKVAALFSGIKSAGNHSILFDAANLGSGIYFYKIVTNEFVQTRKMILEK
jgi:hypothetical protein